MREQGRIGKEKEREKIIYAATKEEKEKDYVTVCLLAKAREWEREK